MLSRFSLLSFAVLVIASALLTSFEPYCISTSPSLFRDSTDSVIEVNVRASIHKYEQVISDYNGKSFSRDSLLIKLEQAVTRSSADSHEIKKMLASWLRTTKQGDTAFNEALFRPLFVNLSTAFAELVSNGAVVAKVSAEIAALKNSMKEIEPAYLTATSVFARIIPDSYLGKLNFVYKGNAYTVFISDSKVHNVNISKSNASGRTLRDGWGNLAKEGLKPVAIFNGGMFNPDFSPTGLLVENSQKISDINIQEKAITGNFFLFPNGIFLIDTSNNFHVLETRAFIKKFGSTKYPSIRHATQSGPMLLIDNKIHKSFTNGSANLHIRNAVGTNSKFPHRVFFAISDDRVNFYDFAVLFKELLRCDNALYLDGAVSKMYIDHRGIKTGRLDADQRLGPLITISQKK